MLFDEGIAWSAIRGELPRLRQSIAASVVADYEVESAYFDDIARELAAAVKKKLAEWSHRNMES